jgi:hypothetical protein
MKEVNKYKLIYQQSKKKLEKSEEMNIIYKEFNLESDRKKSPVESHRNDSFR